MALEIEGKFLKALPLKSGQGKNGTWTQQDFVIVTLDKYPSPIVFSNFNNKVDISKIKPNTTIKVGFNITGREFEGKYYNTLSPWKIDIKDEEQQAIQELASTPQTDDLPF